MSKYLFKVKHASQPSCTETFFVLWTGLTSFYTFNLQTILMEEEEAEELSFAIQGLGVRLQAFVSSETL